jgi:hypothetical protein
VTTADLPGTAATAHGDSAVALAPPPWSLRGDAWVIALRVRGEDGASALGLMAFVDYTDSNCGPYRELLLVPRIFRPGAGLSVARIVVSTIDSMVNGRRNWGLPKELAEFHIVRGAPPAPDRIVVKRGADTLADLRLRASRLRLPFSTRLVPRRLRTFVQRDGEATFTFAPSARGWISPGRLVSWSANADRFPFPDRATVVAAAKIVRFAMTVPAALVRRLTAPAR